MVAYNLNLLILKLIGLLSMTIDHLYKSGLLEENLFYVIFGRFAFPIFAYLLVKGLFLSSNIDEYLKRLFWLSIVSTLPYTWFLYVNSYPFHLNIVFNLWATGSLINYLFIKQSKNPIIPIGLIIISFFSDYSLYGCCLIMLIYLFFKLPKLQLLFISLILFITIVFSMLTKQYQIFSLMAFVVIFIIHYLKSKILLPFYVKYTFYVYYPLHLFIIVIVK